MQIKEMKFLKDDETGEIERIIEDSYGCKIDLREFVVFKNYPGKIWIASMKISELGLGGIEMNSAGLYLGSLEGNGKIRLSIEGSQMAGKKATRNIAVIDDANMEKFIQGFDAEVSEKIGCEEYNFQLVKHRDDFLGCGKLVGNRIMNSTPRNRRTLFTSGRIT